MLKNPDILQTKPLLKLCSNHYMERVTYRWLDVRLPSKRKRRVRNYAGHLDPRTFVSRATRIFNRQQQKKEKKNG